MIAWMEYAIISGACVMIAAVACDWLVRLRRWPVRFVWFAAAVLTILLVVTAPLRRIRVSHPASGQAIDPSVLARMQTGIQSVDHHVPASALWYVAGLWAMLGIVVAGAFLYTRARLRRARRTWPVVDLHGHPVRVAPDLGPVVLGVFRPEIVVPRWVLQCTGDEQRVMIAHEASHIDARDPALLGLMCAVVALMPWNPALWIMLSRLRLAIELDCDARVLRGGVSTHSYGSLLVDVAERALPQPLAMTGLADGSSQLHRRIVAMHPRSLRHPLLRAMGVTLVGLAGLLAACEARMPTAAEIEHMDASSAQRVAHDVWIMPDSAKDRWTVDGVASTEAAAKAIPRDSIVTVSVNHLDPLGSTHFSVVTKRGVALAESNGEPPRHADVRRSGITANGKIDPVGALQTAAETEQPLLLIDGVRSKLSALEALDRTRINHVNILKGPAAIEQYGPDAKRGVIVVVTKPAP